jgi:hypothetical protein
VFKKETGVFTARYELADALVTDNRTDNNRNNAMIYVTNVLLFCHVTGIINALYVLGNSKY